MTDTNPIDAYVDQCRAKGLDPEDDQRMQEFLDSLDPAASDAIARHHVEIGIRYGLNTAAAAGLAVVTDDRVYEWHTERRQEAGRIASQATAAYLDGQVDGKAVRDAARRATWSALLGGLDHPATDTKVFDAKVLRVQYDPTRSTVCGWCRVDDMEAIHAVLDDRPVCGDCLEMSSWARWRLHLEPLDDLDHVLTVAPEEHASMVLDDILRHIWRIAAARVPSGREELLPDIVFVDELVRRKPEQVDNVYDLVRLFAPNATIKDLERCRQAAQIRYARGEAAAMQGEIALVLLAEKGSGLLRTLRQRADGGVPDARERAVLAATFGAALRQARRPTGMSQRTLAARSGVSKAMVEYLEVGLRRPTPSMVRAWRWGWPGRPRRCTPGRRRYPRWWPG